jgi:hypothetical protein
MLTPGKRVLVVDAGGRTDQLYKPLIEGEMLEIARKALQD